MVPGLSILIISFTALIARSFPQDQHLIPHFLPHGMQPIISTLRSRKGVCMSKSEKVPFLQSASSVAVEQSDGALSAFAVSSKLSSASFCVHGC